MGYTDDLMLSRFSDHVPQAVPLLLFSDLPLLMGVYGQTGVGLSPLELCAEISHLAVSAPCSARFLTTVQSPFHSLYATRPTPCCGVYRPLLGANMSCGHHCCGWLLWEEISMHFTAKIHRKMIIHV